MFSIKNQALNPAWFPSFWAVILYSNCVFVHSIVMVATMKKPWFLQCFFKVFRNSMHQCHADLCFKSDLKMALKMTHNTMSNRCKFDQKVSLKQRLFLDHFCTRFLIKISSMFGPFWDQNRPKIALGSLKIASIAHIEPKKRHQALQKWLLNAKSNF